VGRPSCCFRVDAQHWVFAVQWRVGNSCTRGAHRRVRLDYHRRWSSIKLSAPTNKQHTCSLISTTSTTRPPSSLSITTNLKTRRTRTTTFTTIFTPCGLISSRLHRQPLCLPGGRSSINATTVLSVTENLRFSKMARHTHAFTVYEERFSVAHQNLVYMYSETFVPPTMFNFTPLV